MKSTLLSSTKFLWVCSAAVEDDSYPAKALSTGLLRSLRSEDVMKRIVTLTIEDNVIASSGRSIVAQISEVFKKSFLQGSRELEYAVRQDTFWVPRLSYKEQLNVSIREAITPALRDETWASEPPVKLSVAALGALDSLCFTEDHEYETSLGPHQVEIEAKAWGLNFRDVFLALGRLKEADGFGFECAGYVRRVGSHCTGFAPGDRVCKVARNTMRQYPRSDEQEVHQIPHNMSFEEAAGMMGPAITAVYILIEVARLRRGERVLIHSAAGGTGQLAVMLAQSLGAEVYCTVGTEKKKAHLMQHFGIPEERILYSRDSLFAKGIRRFTDGHVIDVLLNSLAGDSLTEGWKCMAPYGRFVEIGKVDIMSNTSLPMEGFQRNVTFTAVDFYHTTLYRKAITKDMLAKVMLLARTGAFTAPNPLHIYPTSKVEAAFRYLQSSQHIGRIVVAPQERDIVSKSLCKKPTWGFVENASYIVVGGFGGLGRAVLPWTVNKGARHLVILSRMGPVSAAAQRVVAELQALGVQVYAPKCDASSRSNLAAVLDTVRMTMPPIKGCINAAMLLQVCEPMHTLNMDFFLLFSSLSGVYGTPDQANYAAGCTSQDALARQRVDQGLKAVSIDIGWMRTIGIVAESELYQRVHTVGEKNDIAVKALVGKIARALAIPAADIDTARPLFEYGVDSLVALELRNWMVSRAP
ncbi:KR-domain-containing protein [Bimuria novae-zelandiae CBS 107.79]|uniref:KR-domain-containing protein n=1 Tax=Bimuria novae-zelandiae CBS 107.79 TaxID=1447943 RepID=A0A6A5V950_9PLEO|nr:KR-domain-containing protein [Bimuria novae-zelandiae CBS 107.79]